MTKYKGKILFMALLLIALTVSTAQADWEVEQIESVYDDGMITETGGKFFETPWVEIQSSTIGLNSYFAFRGVTIPENALINNAYLEFTAPFPWNYNQTLLATVYGLKAGDQPSWNPTPDLNSEPSTGNYTVFDIAPLVSDAQFNVTVTGIVTEIYEMHSFVSNNDMGFRISTVGVSGGVRYQLAYDAEPLNSLKLYIEYTEAVENKTTYYKGYKIEPSDSDPIPTRNQSIQLQTLIVDTGNNKIYMENLHFTNNTPSVFNHTPSTPYGQSLYHAPTLIEQVGDMRYIIGGNALDWQDLRMYNSTDGINWDTFVIIENNATDKQAQGFAWDENRQAFHVMYSVGFTSLYARVYINGTIDPVSKGKLINAGAFNLQADPFVYFDPVDGKTWFCTWGGHGASSLKRTKVISLSASEVWSDLWVDAINTNNGVFSKYEDELFMSNVANGRMKIWYFIGNDTHQDWNLTSLGKSFSVAPVVSDTIGGINNQSVPVIVTVGLSNIGGIYKPVYSESFDGGATWGIERQVTFGTAFKDVNLAKDEDDKIYLLAQYTADESLQFGFYEDHVYNRSQLFYFIPDPASYNNIGYVTVKREMAWSGEPDPGGGFTVTIGNTTLNSTCLDLAVTIEDVQACIDDIEGVTPDDPNPPGTSYPPDGFGELTRFNMRFVFFMVGWVLIFIPPLMMAFRTFPLKIYLYFFIMMVLGFALQWTLGSV